VDRAARALAWEFRPHRWGLLAVGAYTVALAAMGALDAARGIHAAASEARFVGTIVVPLSVAAFYLLALFSFGFRGDLLARRSMYPDRLFTLPVPTSALAGWPMLYGAACMATMALSARLVRWPAGITVPSWIGLFAAVVMVWMQALMWTAYPLRSLRVVAAVGWLTVMDIVMIAGVVLGARDSLMVAILAPQLPLAYLAARSAVARARRGDVPGWRRTRAAHGSTTNTTRGEHRPFATPAEAQRWSEWRRHGWSLPVWVAIVVPFSLALLFTAGDAPAIVGAALIITLLTPPVLAAFVGVGLARASAEGTEAYGVPPFLATRPLTSAALVTAKLRVALRSTLVTWVLVGVSIPVGLSLSHTWPVATDHVRRLRDVIGAPRTIAFTLLTLAVLVSITWKRLTLGMYLGLSGRRWLVKTHLGVQLVMLAFALPLLDWVAGNRNLQAALWNAGPWILGTLACLKIAAVGWVTARLDAGRLVTPRGLIGGAAVWLVAVATLYALLAWMTAAPETPRYVLMLIAVLAIPLARLYAAPLALAWNRHR